MSLASALPDKNDAETASTARFSSATDHFEHNAFMASPLKWIDVVVLGAERYKDVPKRTGFAGPNRKRASAFEIAAVRELPGKHTPDVRQRTNNVHYNPTGPRAPCTFWRVGVICQLIAHLFGLSYLFSG